MRPLPTHGEVAYAVAQIEPATVTEVQRALGADWAQRGTIRNRLMDLVESQALIWDEGRPMRFAINNDIAALNQPKERNE